MPKWRFSFRAAKRTLIAFWKYIKKVLILLTVIATAAIIVSAVCLFISGEIKLSIAIFISIIGLIILGWGLNSLSKYRLSFARTFMILLISGLFIVASSVYLNVKSPADVKESVIKALSTETEQFRSTVELVIQRTELKVIDIASSAEESSEEVYTIEEEIREIEEEETKSLVYINGGILVGADSHYITLQNNPNATNPTWEELKAFLLEDTTDNKKYDFDTFVCADFAELLHNNAEAAGFRAAFVSIELGPCSYFPFGGGHAFNAFETTDRGLVYIDCTSSNQGINADKIVEVEVGKDYIPKSIFPEPGWKDVWANMGVVEEIENIQW